jgi:acyl carrier protein
MEKKETSKLISKALGVKENKLNNKSHIGSLPEWDSLGHLNIFFAIQKKFKKKIDLNEASKIRNISDWHKLISKL